MQLPDYWQEHVVGATLTTMRVGGVVKYVSRPHNEQELLADLKTARQEKLPVLIMGGGSNLILSDAGFEGLIIQPVLTDIEMLTGKMALKEQPINPSAARYHSSGNDYLDLQTAVHDAKGEHVLVRIGSGVAWGQAVAWSLQNSLVGLHWFTRIPCRVGGAIYNNIHGEKHLLSESICCVNSIDLATDARIKRQVDEIGFGYDQSIYQTVKEVITEGIFALVRVDESTIRIIRDQYLEWVKKKTSIQPSGPNCGSVFKNLTPEQAAEVGSSNLAAGWYIEQCQLKGRQVGGMQVYAGHANFMVNATGFGSQSDLLTLIREVRQAVKAKFGFWLEPEVQCLDVRGEWLPW